MTMSVGRPRGRRTQPAEIPPDWQRHSPPHQAWLTAAIEFHCLVKYGVSKSQAVAASSQSIPAPFAISIHVRIPAGARQGARPGSRSILPLTMPYRRACHAGTVPFLIRADRPGMPRCAIALSIPTDHVTLTWHGRDRAGHLAAYGARR